MIEQPKRRIDCPWPVSLGDMDRHADKWIAVEVEWPAIRDLVDGERAKLLAAQSRPKRPLRGKSGGRPQMREQRSEEHTSELQSLMRISYAVFCLKKNKTKIS